MVFAQQAYLSLGSSTPLCTYKRLMACAIDLRGGSRAIQGKAAPSRFYEGLELKMPLSNAAEGYGTLDRRGI